MQIRPVGSEQLARRPVACLQFALGNAGIDNVHRPNRLSGSCDAPTNATPGFDEVTE